MSVQLNTTHGRIVIQLYTKECPKTCRNFIELARTGYYDGVVFHRVIPDFVAQTGDPLGTGHGGESIYGEYFEDEIRSKLAHSQRGIVSMANAGRNTNNSQFFLLFKQSTHLDGKHTVFGCITDDTVGTLDDIEVVATNKNDKPIKRIQIYSAEVLDNPYTNVPLPPNCCIPEKPLVNKKDKCAIS